MNKETTSKKLNAALENLKKAQEKNKNKQFDIWICKNCGIEKKGTVVYRNQPVYRTRSIVNN